VTLEQQLAEQAKRGLLGLGFEQETAEEYAPWASLLAQFLPGVGEGVGIDNTVNAINDERYGDAAIEGGLTLLGAVPVVGDMAAAAIKGIRRAPVKAFDEAAWLKDNPRPHPDIMPKDMTPAQLKDYRAWRTRKYRNKHKEKTNAQQNEYRRNRYENDEDYREKRKGDRRDLYANDPIFREKALEGSKDARRRRWESDPASRGQHNARTRSRKAAQLQRTPVWADPDRIDEIYRTAAEVSAETGIPHHVDHVMPLQGRNVSGLHHQDNLLIVPGAENLSKNNKFEPGDLPPRAGVRKSRAYLKKIREANEKAKR
jgi:hypothetical protein